MSEENPPLYREHNFYDHKSGEPLIQKLCGIATTLEEEEYLTLPDITGRVQAVFDVDRVTKRFYDRFKNEHATFLDFIEGIPDEEMKRWYASVMINRLMFIYFIQKKGFLDSDVDYLKHKLSQSQSSYYSSFLRPLFFEGFAKKQDERSEKTNRLLGEIPYLNGGIFLPHPIEETHADITIRNAAFETLFTFFDQYRWHLDERPLRNDNEINPDVLGYIFEKYINQKQMGAYYTKEDITDYISKNTIIPRIFDMAREKCKIAFEGEQSVWNLLKSDPDRYIYESVRKGTDLELPPEIAAGINDVSKRTEWNKRTPEEYALPTEIWRETVARRQRYEEVKSKLLAGEVNNINDLITYNLDIRQFAQDVITNSEGPELLRAFYHAIEKITVLDPTCGSGAFLFAALNILESLYEACLERMQVFLDELDASGEKHRPEKYSDFRKILDRIENHPTPKYYIYKYIILNNLFGVDIMEEAIEICKLRLFLKLVAQVENVDEIEPLPDIDFNIRAGNTLVGYTTYEEVERAVSSKLDFDNAMKIIEDKAEEFDLLYKMFREQQEQHGGYISKEDKKDVQKILSELENELNIYLSQTYGVRKEDSTAYKKWHDSHKPFHWFIDFHEIMKKGGFDVIIGNPPYVEYSKIKKEYTVKGYKTLNCGNIYAQILERCVSILDIYGYLGMIVQNSLVSTKRMIPIMQLMKKERDIYVSNFDDRPAKLFTGLNHMKGSIVLCNPKRVDKIYSTNFLRWYDEQRIWIFELLSYENISNLKSFLDLIPKISSKIEVGIIKKTNNHKSLSPYLCKNNKLPVYCHRIASYFIKGIDFVPYFWNEKDGEKKSDDYKIYNVESYEIQQSILCIFNSNIFYYFWHVFNDGYHCGKEIIENFHCNLPLEKTLESQLIEVGIQISQDYKKNAFRKETDYKKTGKVIYDELYPKKSKLLINKVDKVLADHYGFNEIELDFIINYNIKYRMGDELNNEG